MHDGFYLVKWYNMIYLNHLYHTIGNSDDYMVCTIKF